MRLASIKNQYENKIEKLRIANQQAKDISNNRNS